MLFLQDQMNRIHRHIAEETGALLAPVGENWRSCMKTRPDLEMYAEDGQHASPAGSDFAAEQIWKTIVDDLHRAAE